MANVWDFTINDDLLCACTFIEEGAECVAFSFLGFASYAIVWKFHERSLGGILSNTFAESKRIKWVCPPLSSTEERSCVTEIDWLSHDLWLRNPCCRSFSRIFLSRRSVIDDLLSQFATICMLVELGDSSMPYFYFLSYRLAACRLCKHS